MSSCVAYFSAEFGIDESLPIYSGGLGILAGDHIKAASDLGLPLVAIGIFYGKGYFQQRIGEEGTQQHFYPELDKSSLPIRRVQDTVGLPLEVQVPIAGRTIYLEVWAVQVGEVPLYLLNSDVEQNSGDDRRLTDNLYASDPDIRISQEMILGIGGVRLLDVLGIRPDVWHMNEGHSAFLTLERIRTLSASGVPFETALEAVRASTVFTTHTPVPAGHDVFGIDRMDRYFGDYYWQLGADRETVLALGQVGDGFNMTRLAVNTASKVNGVSRLHAEVTRELFHSWAPHIPRQDIPVEAVTNGIHIGTWVSSGMAELFDRYLPQWKTRAAEADTWSLVRDIPASELWEVHRRSKAEMIRKLGLSVPSLPQGPLVVGFARRFATYKRALLIFQDPDRLDRIVNDPERPVCFVFAGKAHPSDGPGQELIRKIVEMSKSERFRGRILMVENYAMDKAKLLVQGVDVWLNTPVKPMEASGTSGQKAAVNGVLNCSVLDGWWCEGYNGRNGWAINGEAEGDEAQRTKHDSGELYRLLEEQIVPLFYRTDSGSVPGGWVQMMKESICSLAPVFNTHRMVKEYWHKLYVPAAERGSRFAADGFEVARRVAAYKAFIARVWHQVHVQRMNILAEQGTRIGLGKTVVRAEVKLGPVWHKDVRVEAVGSDGKGGIWKAKLSLVKQLNQGVFLYEAAVTDQVDVLRANANVRVVPVSPDFSSDFEMGLAAWG